MSRKKPTTLPSRNSAAFKAFSVSWQHVRLLHERVYSLFENFPSFSLTVSIKDTNAVVYDVEAKSVFF